MEGTERGTESGMRGYSFEVVDEQSEVRPSLRRTVLCKQTVRAAAWSIEGQP